MPKVGQHSDEADLVCGRGGFDKLCRETPQDKFGVKLAQPGAGQVVFGNLPGRVGSA